MRAAICVRVSPRPQDKVKYSPELQEQKCREWCEANGHEVVTVVQDILVSGGASNRFDSVFATLDATPVDILVVSDLSRWTRDEPEVYWTVKARLTARGVQLHSVDEPYLSDEDVPFRATIQTMLVEMNARERQVLRQKTSAGIRAAKASGKTWWRHFGWTWNSQSRTYDKDEDRIKALFEAWNRGEPARRIAQTFGIRTSHVRRAVTRPAQRAVVGDELWLQAQRRPMGRDARLDRKAGNVYRSLLHCPFCGDTLYRPTRKQPFDYGCRGIGDHPWRYLNVNRWVTPAVQDALHRLVVPEEEISLANQANTPAVQANTRDYAAEIERLTMAWSKGRISDERYERTVTALEAERDRPVPLPPPVPHQVELSRFAELADLTTQDPEEADALNRVLREALTISLGRDRLATVEIREPYRSWAR